MIQLFGQNTQLCLEMMLAKNVLKIKQNKVTPI